MARSAWRLWRASRQLPATSAQFRKRLDRALKATTPERVATLSLTELAAEYRRIEADLLDRWDAPIVNDFLCMIAFGAARKALEGWAGAEGTAALNDVLIGQGDIISARPAQLIRAMGETVRADAALLAALDAQDRTAVEASAIGPGVAGYIAEFGDRCTEELKLESVTLDEDPTPLFAAIAAAARSRHGPAPERGDPWARLDGALRGKPVKRRVARWLVRWAKDRVRDRENLRYERTRIFGRARRVLLAMGTQFHAMGLHQCAARCVPADAARSARRDRGLRRHRRSGGPRRGPPPRDGARRRPRPIRPNASSPKAPPVPRQPSPPRSKPPAMNAPAPARAPPQAPSPPSPASSPTRAGRASRRAKSSSRATPIRAGSRCSPARARSWSSGVASSPTAPLSRANWGFPALSGCRTRPAGLRMAKC